MDYIYELISHTTRIHIHLFFHQQQAHAQEERALNNRRLWARHVLATPIFPVGQSTLWALGGPLLEKLRAQALLIRLEETNTLEQQDPS